MPFVGSNLAQTPCKGHMLSRQEQSIQFVCPSLLGKRSSAAEGS